MLGRLLPKLGTDLYAKRACHSPNSRRFHRSSVGCIKLPIEKVKNEEALKWLENLSPEMKARKREIEHMVRVCMDLSGKNITDEISPADLKQMMIECKSISAVSKFLKYKIKTSVSKARRDNRQKLKEQSELLKKQLDYKKVPVSSSYTMNSNLTYKRMEFNQILSPFMIDATPIIFDMDYKQTIREEKRTVEQLQHSININKNFTEPCHIHVTSFKRNSQFDMRTKCGDTFPSLTMHEEGFEELFPREKLVYLSPDAPQLRQHKPGDIYIIAGLVDLHSKEPLSLQKAEQMKIRHGSIPFEAHGIPARMLRSSHRYDLTLIEVYTLLLDINIRHDWKLVLTDFIEKRNCEGYIDIYKPEILKEHKRQRREKNKHVPETFEFKRQLWGKNKRV